MANEDEPDDLERVMRSITDPDALRQLTVDMTDIGLGIFQEMLKGCTTEQANDRDYMDRLTDRAKQKTRDDMPMNIRRWLIKHGYL